MFAVNIVEVKKRIAEISEIIEHLYNRRTEVSNLHLSIRIEGETMKEKMDRKRNAVKEFEVPNELIVELKELNSVLEKYSNSFLGMYEIPNIMIFCNN